MGAIGDALDEVVAQLTAAGITATTDPAAADLPGAIVYPARIDFDRLGGDGFDMDVDVVLVARQLVGRDAVDQLDTLVSAFRAWCPAVEFTAVSVALTSQAADPLPALRATLPVEVTTT